MPTPNRSTDPPSVPSKDPRRRRPRRRPPFPGDQPPELSPEDVAALDRANDKVGREMDQKRKAARAKGKGK